MTKITLTDLVNLQNETTAVNAVNANNATIEVAIDNTLSRDGTAPNQMAANLDMNSNRIVNLPAPLSLQEPLRLVDANTLNGGGTISSIPAGGTTGQVLQKSSNSDYNVTWGRELPAGGTTGQILTKNTNTNYDVNWANTTTIVNADTMIGLTLAQIGNGGTVNYANGDSRISLRTNSVLTGDGLSLQANNILTKIDRPTRIYFVLYMDFAEDRGTDLQFGLRSSDGVNTIRFSMVTAPAAHANIFAGISNGSSHLIDTNHNDITNRHVYMIEYAANGEVNFWVGANLNNSFQLGATFAANDSAMPSAGASLLPYVQIRTNGASSNRTLTLDTIYSIFAW